MTTEEKFNAAVNVIRNLPKNGSYQPSPDLQLKFYSYFKQSTIGPITQKKPAFWDIPGMAKWYAWKSLGDMPREESMTQYIELLKSIVETMSYNADVETFLTSLGSFYDYVPAHDVDLVLGPVIERVKSRALSLRQGAASSESVGSVDTPPPSSSDDTSSSVVVDTSRYQSGDNGHIHLNSVSGDTDTDDEFNDPMESTPEPVRKNLHSNQTADSATIEVLTKTAERMQKDLDNVHQILNSIQNTMTKLSNTDQTAKVKNAKGGALSPLWLGLIIVWPLAVSYVVSRLNRRKC